MVSIIPGDWYWLQMGCGGWGSLCLVNCTGISGGIKADPRADKKLAKIRLAK